MVVAASAWSAPLPEKEIRTGMAQLQATCMATQPSAPNPPIPPETLAPSCACTVEKMTDWLHKNDFQPQAYMAAEQKVMLGCLVPRMKPTYYATAEKACAGEAASMPKLKARGEAFVRDLCACVGSTYADAYAAATLAGQTPSGTEIYNQAAQSCSKR
jgi:hypothetical protein